KGTTRRSARQIAEEIDSVGGELNAFTTRESTCFYAHVLDTDLPLAVDLVSDVVFDGQCSESDTELERTVVLDEIAMRDDDPDDWLHELFAVALMGDHPLARPILGTEKSITGMTAGLLQNFHRTTYRPHRMVLAVAGTCDTRTCCGWPRRSPRAIPTCAAAGPSPLRHGPAGPSSPRRTRCCCARTPSSRPRSCSACR